MPPINSEYYNMVVSIMDTPWAKLSEKQKEQFKNDGYLVINIPKDLQKQSNVNKKNETWYLFT